MIILYIDNDELEIIKNSLRKDYKNQDGTSNDEDNYSYGWWAS